MKKRKFPPGPPHNILVITPLRIGDVLLVTPVIGSLRRAYPAAQIDVLVSQGTEGVIMANKEIDHVIAVDRRANFREQVRTIFKLFRRYDLAISTLTGDRPTFYACLAGKRRIGPVENGYKHLWKRLLLHRGKPFDNWETHTVKMNLSLLEFLDIEQSPEVVVSWTDRDVAAVRQSIPFDMEKEAFAVVHVYPMFPYKMWYQSGWIDLIRWLASKGLRAVLTGANLPEETDCISRLCESVSGDCTNMAGRLTLGGVGFLLSRASVYVGVDTVITHMAAASGIPTIALFGPTNPVKWGPMPAGISLPGKSPYKRSGSQIVKNVFLLQGSGECVPCHEEGCGRHTASLSRCLQTLSSAEVIDAVQTMLADETRGLKLPG